MALLGSLRARSQAESCQLLRAIDWYYIQQSAVEVLLVGLFTNSSFFLSFLELDPSNVPMWNKLGLCFTTTDRSLGESDLSSEMILKGIGVFHNSLSNHLFSAEALFNLGCSILRLKEAIPEKTNELHLSGYLALLWSLSAHNVCPQEPYTTIQKACELLDEWESSTEAAERYLNKLRRVCDIGAPTTSCIQSFIAERIQSEINELRRAYLISVLYLCWDDSLSEAIAVTLTTTLMAMLNQNSFEVESEYLPSACYGITQMQAIAILQTLIAKRGSLVVSAIQTCESLNGLVLSRHAHPVINQLVLGLLAHLPSETLGHGGSSNQWLGFYN